MKYDKSAYIGSQIYGWGDGEAKIYSERIVKCRKTHTCYACYKEIEIGEQAICEKGFMDGEPSSSYTCIKCIEDWLEVSGQVEK